MRLRLQYLNSETQAEFQHMTFPLFRQVLSTHNPLALAVGAYVSGRPAGLALGFQPTSDKVDLLSLFVEPPYRREGIGAEMLRAFESESERRGANRVAACYTADLSRGDELGMLLSRSGWLEPAPRMLVCHAGKKIVTAPWIAKYRLPSKFAVIPWPEITAGERQALERRRAQIPETLFPLDWEVERYPLESTNSIAIRSAGELSGWLITHRLSQDTVRYTCAYVNANLQRLAVGVGLIIEAIERQVTALGPESRAIWATPFKYAAMIAFIRRRMAPYLDSLRESRESFKTFEQATRISPVVAQLTDGL
ncbi:MAG: GNAT family N-acetyltransferase [Bryobacteraceae bacterium]